MTTTQRAKRVPSFTTDASGNEVALIPLANHPTPARILRKDFEALCAEGWSDQWTFNDSGNGFRYVKVGNGESLGNLAIVARLLMKPERCEQVRYRDGDRTNLLRENLHLEADSRGRKGMKPKAKLEAEVHRFEAEVARMV